MLNLPINKYICYIDKLQWNMDEETLTLGKMMRIQWF